MWSFFENWLYDTVQFIDGIPVISLKSLIEMKQRLGREKDRRDIRLIAVFWQRNKRVRRTFPVLRTFSIFLY